MVGDGGAAVAAGAGTAGVDPAADQDDDGAVDDAAFEQVSSGVHGGAPSNNNARDEKPGLVARVAMVTNAMPSAGSALVSLSRCGREGNALIARVSDGEAGRALQIHVVLLSALVVVQHPYQVARHALWAWFEHSIHDSSAYV